ncbi:hypothetical protein CEXT_145541, partial [Caerostris extrusa]
MGRKKAPRDESYRSSEKSYDEDLFNKFNACRRGT